MPLDRLDRSFVLGLGKVACGALVKEQASVRTAFQLRIDPRDFTSQSSLRLVLANLAEAAE